MTGNKPLIIDTLYRLWARQDVHLQEVLKGSSSALAIRTCGMLAGFVVSIVIARALGADGAGIYFLSLSIATIAATASRLGFENTVVRFVAANAAGADWPAVRSVYAGMLKVVVPASLLVSVALFVFAAPLAEHVFGKLRLALPLRFAACAIAPLALLMTQAEALRGLKKIPSSQFIKTVGVSLVTLALVYPLMRVWNVDGAVMAYTLATIAVAALAHRWWKKSYARAAADAPVEGSRIAVKMLLFSSMPLLGFMLCDLLVKQAGTVLLGVWGTSTGVGIFSVAARVAALLQFPLLALMSILAPKFSGMIRLGEYAALQKLARRSALLLVVSGLPVALLMAATAAPIMSIFGAQFIIGANVLRILLIGVLINVMTGSVGTLLMMADYGKECLRASTAGIVALLGSAWFLIPDFGPVGAAVAISLGVTVQNVVMLGYVKRRLGFWLVPG